MNNLQFHLTLDVLAARQRIAPPVIRTPLIENETLNTLTSGQILIWAGP